MTNTQKYSIIRFFATGRRYTITNGITLDAARKHCADPQTSSDTCTTPTGKARTKKCGTWFDGYAKY